MGTAHACPTAARMPCRSLGTPRVWRRGCLIVRAGTTNDAAQPRDFKLRMCVNTTCQAQGSEQIAQFIGGLGVEGLEVTGRECLGNCGNGPNALLEAPGSSEPERQLSRLTTPEAAAQALREFCGLDVDEAVLRAADLRLAGSEAASRGDMEAAEYLFSEGLALNPSLGRHLLLMNRSEIRLVEGDAVGGLADAQAAAAYAPAGYTFPYVLQVEALLQLGRSEEAGVALAAAVASNPEFAQDPDYAMLLEAVQGGELQHVES